jgi:hypothetical protein
MAGMGHQKVQRIVKKPCKECGTPTTMIEIVSPKRKPSGAMGQRRRKVFMCVGCVGKEA